MMMDTRVSRNHAHVEIDTPFASRPGADFIVLRVTIHEIPGLRDGLHEEWS